MELTKEQSIKGDNFLNELLSEGNLQRQSVYNFFSDRNEAILICDFLSKKNFIKLLAPTDTEPFSVIEKKDGLSFFLKNGGLTKIAVDLEIEKKASEEKIKNQKELEFLNKKLTKLSIINIELQNRKLKRELLFGIIGFIIGVIITNWKDILILMNVLPSK